MRDRPQRAALVGRLATVPERELDREDADHRVDDAAGDEARAGKYLERRRLLEPLAGLLGLTDRLGGAVDAHTLDNGRDAVRGTGEASSCELDGPIRDELVGILALLRAPPERRGRGAAVEEQLSQRVLEGSWPERPPRR